MTGLSAQEGSPGSWQVSEEPPDPWDVLPDPDQSAPGHEVDDEVTGAYRGRRRVAARQRTRLAVTAVVVTAVGVVLVGSSLAVRLLSAPVAAPVVPPSEAPLLSPSPSPVSLSPPPPIDGPSPVAGLGPAPEPSPEPSAPPEPSPEPSPPPSAPPDDPSPEPVSLAFEAESAQRAGDADVVSERRASGGAAVDLDGSGSWCLVRFTDVALDQDGGYDLTIHYLSRWEDSVAWVSVNDGRPVAVGFPETSGDSIGTRTVRAGLDAGDNVIMISSPSCDDAPRLDQITVTD